MEPHARAVLQRLRARKHLEDRVGEPRLLEGAGRDERLPARNLLDLDAGQVDGGALSGHRFMPLLAVHLDPAHLHETVARRDGEFRVGCDAPRHQRPCHDGAEAFHGEHAIDRQPGRPFDGAAVRVPADVGQRRTDRVQPFACPRGHRNHRGAVQERSGDQLADVHARELQRVGVDEVGFGQRDEACRHAQQAADVEVLARLRHDRLVGRHDQHHEIDAADAGQHVLHEPLVAGHVDEREGDVVDRLVREPEVDGDAARFFLFEPVGVGPGQCAHERALAVIDVSRGADDDGLHVPCVSWFTVSHPCGLGVRDGRGAASAASRPSGCSCCAAGRARLPGRARGCPRDRDPPGACPC